MAQDTARRRQAERSTRVLRRTSVLIIATIVLLLAGCHGNPREIAAQRIAEALPGEIGPARRYKVRVDGDPFSLARGHVRRVEIDGQDVQLTPSLTMSSIHIDARDIALNTKTRQVDHAGAIEFEGAIGQINLDRYLAGTKHGIAGLSVKIRWTDLEASVPVAALGISTTVRVNGVLEPNGKNTGKLDFVPYGGAIGLVPVPHRLVEMAMNRINPVLALSGMKFPVNIQSTHVENGRLWVTGTADLTAK